MRYRGKNSLFFILTFGVVILSFVNIYMYIFRYHHGYMYTKTFNYNELYSPAENYRIKNFENLPNDSLKISILPSPPICDWVIQDSKGRYNEKSAKLPTIKLLPGKQLYRIKTLGAAGLDSLILTIEHNDSTKYTFVSFCSLPIIEYKLYPIKAWTRLPKNISVQEINEVKEILKDSIGISDSGGNTCEKIIKIGRYLVRKLRPAEGTPSDTIKQLTPLMQYTLACKRKDHIDCANYTNIYFLFANCAGIPTRRVGVAGKIGHVITSGHVFDESYIKEQKKWAFIDLMSKRLVVLNDKKEALNTIDLLNINTSETFAGTKALIIDSLNRVDTVAYAEIKNTEVAYFKPTAQFYYIVQDVNSEMGFIDSFKEYLGKKSHYGIYYSGTLKIENGKHYLKLFVFIISVAIFIVWLIVFFYKILFDHNSGELK